MNKVAWRAGGEEPFNSRPFNLMRIITDGEASNGPEKRASLADAAGGAIDTALMPPRGRATFLWSRFIHTPVPLRLLPQNFISYFDSSMLNVTRSIAAIITFKVFPL